MSRQSSLLIFIAGLVCGALTGAGLALLLAPQSGQEMRTSIKEKGFSLKARAQNGMLAAGRRVQAQAQLWQEKSKEVVEKGKHAAIDVLSASKDSLAEAVHPHRPNGLV